MNYFLLPCELIGAAVEALLTKASDFFAGRVTSYAKSTADWDDL